MYTALAEDLASRGHVVALTVPVTTPARVVSGQRRGTAASTAPPGPAQIDRLIEQVAADMTALLTALPGRAGLPQVDAGSAVFVGHSLGGAAAAAACDTDARCVGSVNLDGPQPATPAVRPRLLVGGDDSCAVTTPCEAAGAPGEYVEWLGRRRAASPAQQVLRIKGAGHNAFTDGVHYFAAPPVGPLLGVGSISPAAMHDRLTTVLTRTVEELLESDRLPVPA